MKSNYFFGKKRNKIIFFWVSIFVINVVTIALLLFSTRNKVYLSKNEFVKTINCAELFDKYGIEKEYLLSFDLKASKEGEVLVYQQNGSSYRYTFRKKIKATTEYKHYELTIKPEIHDLETKDSYLAFYGEYDSGVIPTVKKISITVK